MVFDRLSRRITLFLSALSLFVSIIALVYQKPQTWYLLPAVAFPPIVVFALLIPRRKNIPIKGSRVLAKSKAEQLLAASLAPQDYPPCIHLCSAHAHAASVAALVSRTVLLSIEQLELMMVHEIREMTKLEEAFCIDVVETHLRILRGIHSKVSSLMSKGNLVAECYRQLRGGEPVMETIEELDYMIENDIINPMDTFLQDIPPNVSWYEETDDYKDYIKELITKDIPNALSSGVEKLFEAKEPANKIYEDMRKDWHMDVHEQKQNVLCKPINMDPPRKTGMAIDSILKLVNIWKEEVEKALD